jgi:hypothetical protein
MTGFALNVYLAQVLYPAPDQKVELALAFTVLNLGLAFPRTALKREHADFLVGHRWQPSAAAGPS